MLSRDFMPQVPDSARLVKSILNTVPQASEIWFYGSRARGKHRGDSDWDILVVVPDEIFGGDFLDIQLALEELSTKFANHDIQAAHSWSILYRDAQQEGRQLWKKTPEQITGLL
jgi:predicted nucleotidyltransferase